MEDELILPGAREEQLEIIKKFRLIDDTFMTKVFEDKECAELLLRVILDREDLTVVKAVPQLEIKNLQGRSTRLDIYAVDKDGKNYDIEVQRDNDGAKPKRARYNSSLLDSNSIAAGRDESELPENYVIFITEHDVLKGGKPIYTIHRKIEELDNADFNDESHIIYVNGEIRGDTGLGRLMQDFFCSDPHKMHNEALSRRAKYFKETEEGVKTMCKLMEDYGEKNRERGRMEGRKEGRIETLREIALNMWNGGMRDLQQIANVTKLSVDEVKELIEERSV